jgi:peptide/nickel transport system substrate-binding protein
MVVRERALDFALRASNDIQAEMWNQNSAGFPFTGATQYDVRKDLVGMQGPLWRQWVDTSGKQGVEPPAEIKKVWQLIDQAITVGPADQAKLAQELFKIWVDNMFEMEP